MQLADTTRCASVAIAALDLLRTVSDPDGDALAIRNVTTSSGTLVRDGDGWLFDADAAGSVTFTYEVTDGEFVITQTATLNVVDHAFEPSSGGDGGSAGGTTGTGGDDLILGTPFPDRIDGGAGDDNIDARGGADFVDGGPGDDNIVGGAGGRHDPRRLGARLIFAGAGRDVVSGGDGNDRIFGEDGDDTLFGDDGDDVVDGGAGSDILVGGNGDDALHGGEGDDRLDGSQGNDVALAGAGTDVVLGGAGDDRLEGGEGDDLISDGTGRDSVLGQEGDDVLAVALDGEADTFDGGDGVDTLDLTPRRRASRSTWRQGPPWAPTSVRTAWCRSTSCGAGPAQTRSPEMPARMPCMAVMDKIISPEGAATTCSTAAAAGTRSSTAPARCRPRRRRG